MKEQTRRMVGVTVSMDILQEMFTTGWRADVECVIGLPDGAEFVGGAVHQGGEVVLFFVHESFAPIPACEVPVLLDIKFTKRAVRPAA